MRMTTPLMALLTLSTGCECGAPWVYADCAEPGIYLSIEDTAGNLVEPDHVAIYVDDVLVEDLECTTDYCNWPFIAVYDPGTYRFEVTVGSEVQTYETEVLTIPESQCCGGFYERGVLTFEPPVSEPDTCETLTVDECPLLDGCATITGWETVADAEGALCVDYGTPQVDVGCHAADLGCAAVISFAQPPDGGSCVVFGGCVPAGWVPCDGDPVVNECPVPQ